MKDDENIDDAEFVDEEEDANPAASLKKLRERLKKAVAEKQEYLDGWQRARAEFANYKKQELENTKEKEERSKAEVVEKLLPALDALELALRHEPENKTLKMIESQFLSSLKTVGITQYGAVGDELDPRYYEPLSQVSVDDEAQDHMVVSVERSGYRIGETVIRPAQVIIGRYKIES